jgi:hypothetical protein
MSLWLLGALIVALAGDIARGQTSSTPPLEPPSQYSQGPTDGSAAAIMPVAGQAFAGTAPVESDPPPAVTATVAGNTANSTDSGQAFYSANAAQPDWNGGSCSGCAPQDCRAGFFAGADFLFVRPHFSEATAFAQGSLGPGGLMVTGQELNFDYQAAFRVFGGYRFEGGDTELRFTYTRITDQVDVDGGNPSPGRFLVDPFGNVVGTAPVVDPNSALFGQSIVGGDHIHTEASVTLNAYDLELVKPIALPWSQWALRYSLGVRVADIDQSYESVVDSNGAFFSGGQYTVDFLGAGPRVGLQGQRFFGKSHSWSLFANTYGSLLVGEYDEHFSQTTTAPPFAAQQVTKIIRTVPVAEIEMGGSWSPCSWLNLSAGWLFQAWFDMGTSGGKFGGYYTVTENSNIMSFEGFFARGEITF